MRIIVGFLLFVSSLSAQLNPALANLARDPNEDKYIGKKEHVAAGKDLYMLMCSGCHGPSGEGGRGPNLMIGPATLNKRPTDVYHSIKNGVPGSDMPPFPMPEEQLWQLTAYVRSLSRPAYEIDVPGDKAAGEALFYGKAGCSNCHTIRGRGGHLGPDLSNAGLRNYMYQLREGVLEPDKRIAAGFDPVRVTTTTGEKIDGVAKSYTNYAFQVLDRDGELHLLGAHDVKEVLFLKKTWMPDITEQLKEDEVQNVLAFLSRQAARIPAPSEDEGE